jgi:3-phosphoshikimate 1-carboxyvinyltransferase
VRGRRAAPRCARARTSTLRGLGTLPGKESDRLSVLSTACAARAWRSRPPPTRCASGRGARRAGREPVRLDPRGDHRMAFAFALLGLLRPGVEVADPDCVQKSWGTFWSDLERLGAVPSR